VALTSPHKLGGFVSLCGFLPRWDKLLVQPSDKNKETSCLIINNSGDPWVPFWTGKKSYELLKEHGYNVKFKTLSGLGHIWKNKDIVEFLEKNKSLTKSTNNTNVAIILFTVIVLIIMLGLVLVKLVKRTPKTKH
jgi:predicted esterase